MRNIKVVAAAVSAAEIVGTGAWHKRLYIAARERYPKQSAIDQELGLDIAVHVNIAHARCVLESGKSVRKAACRSNRHRCCRRRPRCERNAKKLGIPTSLEWDKEKATGGQ
jgi:hypothetical protein